MTLHSKAVKEPMEFYQKHPAISGTKIKTMLRSPAHFKDRYIDGNEDKPTPAKQFGILAHTAILEPKLFQEHMVLKPEFKGEGSRKAKKEWEESLPPTALVMDQEEADEILGMIASVQNYEVAASLLRKGIAEHSFYYNDPDTGTPCKFRPDYVTEDGWLVNIKTAASAQRHDFMSAMVRFGYHVSVAHELIGYRAIYGHDAKGYAFVVIEKGRPFVCAVYSPDTAVVDIGETERKHGMKLIMECYASQDWRFQRGAENISVPNWKMYSIAGDDGTELHTP